MSKVVVNPGQRDAAARAAAVLQRGERLVGGHAVVADGRLPTPRRRRCPVVLRGRRMLGDRLAGLLYLPVRLVHFWEQMQLFDRTAEAVMWNGQSDRHAEQPFFGGWDSQAGLLTCGLFPRTKTGVVQVLLLTEQRLQLVYVQKSRLGGRLGEGVETGWGVDLREVAWIRDRSDVRGGTHEIGFRDGSWTTVVFRGDGWSRFAAAFPNPLRHTDVIP